MTDPTGRDIPVDEKAFVELATRYLDGQADDATVAELSQALRTSADFRELFTFLSYEARLLHHTHTSDIAPSAPAPPPASVVSEPAPAANRFRLVGVFAAAAALLVACGLAVYVFVIADADPPIEPPAPAMPVATLIEATGGTLTTPDGYPSEGSDYPTGTYTLDGGFAEFMLTNSVNVKLRGSTRMRMHNAMNVSLVAGRADFAVPPGATGFTVHLPDGTRLVDLGTAFGVEIIDDGRRRLRVTEGVVRIDLTDRDGADRCVLVTAGSVARLAQDPIRGPWVTHITDDIRVIVPVIAEATSELTESAFDRSAARAHDGSGLDVETGTHEAIPTGTMWLSSGVGFNGSSADDPHPAITFDLGGLYLLESMRVWNYNETTQGLHRRGIKDARVLVSTDGVSFTALTDPSDGDRVFTFDPAAGRSDTDFSQTITLTHDAPVRVVRIEAITTHEGSDFDAGRIADEGFTGLSEVRFSGSPIIQEIESNNTKDRSLGD